MKKKSLFRILYTEKVFYSTNYMKNTFPFVQLKYNDIKIFLLL